MSSASAILVLLAAGLGIVIIAVIIAVIASISAAVAANEEDSQD